MIFFFIIIILIMCAFAGLSLLNYFEIFGDESGLLRFFVGFGIIFGLVGLQMFIYSLIGIEWNVITLLLPILIVSIFGLDLLKKIRLKSVFELFSNKLSSLLVILILFLCLFTIFESVIRPLSSWDAWSSWQMKAKIYYFDGKILPERFFYLQSEYPIIVSLFSTFIYKIVGGIYDTLIQFISAFFYIGIGSVIFSFLRRRTSFLYSLLFTFMLLSTQNLIRHGGRYEAGLADIIVGFFGLISIISLIKLVDNLNMKNAFIFYLLLGILSQIKNEGTSMSVFLCLISIFVIFKQNKLFLIKWVLFFLVPLITWTIYKYVYHLPLSTILYHFNLNLSVFFKVSLVEFKEFINIQNWNLGWIIFIIGLLLAIACKQKKYYPYYLFIILQLFIYIIIFLFSSVDPIYHSSGIIDRLLLHLYPLAVLISALMFYAVLKTIKTKNKKINGLIQQLINVK